MKIENKAQYAERFKRRGAKVKAESSTHTQDFRVGIRLGDGSKPNHAARAQSIDDVFAGNRPVRTKDKLPGAIVVGDFKKCLHTLVAWEPYIDPEDFAAGRTHRLEYHAYAYPCMVDHGWEPHRHMALGTGLVLATGKKGEHQDALGRRW